MNPKPPKIKYERRNGRIHLLEKRMTLGVRKNSSALEFAGLAASIAIISALCIVRLRRKSSSSTHAPMSNHDSHKVVVTNNLNNNACTNVEAMTTSLEHEQQHPSTSDNTTQNDDVLVKELPLPPALQQHPNVDPKIVKRAAS
ncbi:hypothetical protein Fmac_031807 [Flemingia macrophylla]|uniref:Uncharacterized protein n=1 Tax=Flemingia macrophylla TaxID=520843 RepID=A0ABD1L348_9FABA